MKNWIKYKANQIFDGYKFLPPNSVLITDAQGFVEDIVSETEAGEGVTEMEGILCPGFINTHCHTELSYLKNKIEPNIGLVNFLIEVTKQRNNYNLEEIEESIENAFKEMEKNGIVAVGDICNTSLSIKAKNKTGIKIHNFIETIGFDARIAEEKIKQSILLKQKFKEELPFTNTSICAHAPYSVSNNLLELINENINVDITSIHNQETAEEDIWFMQQKGDFIKLFKFFGFDTSLFVGNKNGSLANTVNYITNASSLILVHNTFTGLKSVEDLKAKIDGNNLQNIYWCLCPNANIYIENKLPNLQLLVDSNIPIVLGTDSLASNGELNILSEIATLQKKFPTIKLETFLQAATINGAKALKMESTLGTFTKGKKPGVLLLKINSNSLIEEKLNRLD